jgi:hypothetical protein
MRLLDLEGRDPIQEAINNLGNDAGAVYEPAILERLRSIRANDPAVFARLRAQVKGAKVLAMVDFDRLTAGEPDTKAVSGSMNFATVEPWPSPVNSSELLDDIATAMTRYVIADKETIRAASLWVAFTWLVDVVQIAPIANITAPEKRCGKTMLLSVLGRLVRRPLQASNIAPAALYRSIELWSPTLLVDEVDAFLTVHEDARGILNAGFSRDSAVVIRCVGDEHVPTPFNVWGAKALCGIGKIADTLADRSVPLRMRRKMSGEKVERLRHSDPRLWESLCSRLSRFAMDSAEAIRLARPIPIEGLNDRANDCWEPLLAIADLAGGHWPSFARSAAIALHGLEVEAPSIGAELLADVRAVFQAKAVTRVFSAELLEALIADDEQPWATWNRGKPMSPRQLASKLAEFGIKSNTVRQGLDTRKGYLLEQFNDSFTRYLSSGPSFLSATPSQPSSDETCSDFQSVTHNPDVTDRKRLKATIGEGCDGVTDRTPQGGEKGRTGALFGGEI